MDKHLLIPACAVAGLVFLAGCSQAPKSTPETKPGADAKKEPPAPPQPIAGHSAFSEMYRPVRSWAPDALPLTLASGEIAGVKNEGGKAGMWTAVFVSPSRREARTIFYSVADSTTTAQKLQKGVTVGGAQSWSGPTPKSRPFGAGEFLVNSDDAFRAAMEKAGPWVKKHPGRKLSLYLASSSRSPTATWYVMWGDTKSGYLAFVNATTGEVVTSR